MKTFEKNWWNSFFKIIGISGCAFFLFQQVNGQDSHMATPDPTQQSFVNFDPNKDVFSMSGSRISSPDLSEVSGDPFLLPYFVKGTVVFINGTVYRDGLLQFNLLSNQLQFFNNNRSLTFAQPVKSFTLIDTTGGVSKIAWFNSGYPPFGMHNLNTFYQVLATGPRIQLLKFISKHTTEQYQYNDLPKLHFKRSEDLLVYDHQSQEMKFISNSAGSIEKVLGKINPEAQQMVKDMGKKKFTEEEIIALVTKVNSL